VTFDLDVRRDAGSTDTVKEVIGQSVKSEEENSYFSITRSI